MPVPTPSLDTPLRELGDDTAAERGMTDLLHMLQERLRAVRHRIEILHAQEAMLVDMVQTASAQPEFARRAPHSSIKRFLLDALKQAGPQGLKAKDVFALAEKRNIRVRRATVAGILSRLKGCGVVTHDGTAYRLKEYTVGDGDRR